MEKKQINKMLPIGIAVVLVVVILVLVFVLLFNKKEAYRIIKVYEVNGEATVTRETIGQMDAYQNMVLESGDTVLCKSGEMTLKLDEDKFVYVEADTQFRLIATGNAANSKTNIELDHGAITNEIQNPLGKDSSYEVNTPNSNMSVRGTVFRVHTYFENGIRYSKVSVFEGKVESKLRYADGSLSDDVVVITNGNEVIIYDNEESTDYLGEPREIDYEDLSQSVKDLITKILGDIFDKDDKGGSDDGDDGAAETEGADADEQSSTEEENEADAGEEQSADDGAAQDLPDTDAVKETPKPEESAPTQTPAAETQTPSSYTVTFLYNGAVFGTQTVESGKLATKPKLMPSASGSWNFDFNTQINSDTTIEWR